MNKFDRIYRNIIKENTSEDVYQLFTHVGEREVEDQIRSLKSDLIDAYKRTKVQSTNEWVLRHHQIRVEYITSIVQILGEDPNQFDIDKFVYDHEYDDPEREYFVPQVQDIMKQFTNMLIHIVMDQLPKYKKN